MDHDRDTGSLIDTLKRRDTARPFIDAGHQPGAADMERAFGKAAQRIPRDAESRAQMLPRDEFERRMEAFKAWRCRCELRMHREIERVFEPAFRRAKKNPISEARRQATGHGEAEFHQWVDGYALAAWIRASEDLLTLDRPSAVVATQEGRPALARGETASGQRVAHRYTTGQPGSRAAPAFYSEGDCL